MKTLHKNLKVDDSVFIAPSATVIGDVTLEEGSSIWYGAVLRGDSDTIAVGKRSNVQDNAVVHVDPGENAVIGDDCIIGHGAIVHGAELKNNVLVGMNAVVLNGAIIGEYSIVGAHSLVTAGTIIPPKSLVLGSPAKVVKAISDQQMRDIEKNAAVYVEKAKEHKSLWDAKAN